MCELSCSFCSAYDLIFNMLLGLSGILDIPDTPPALALPRAPPAAVGGRGGSPGPYYNALQQPIVFGSTTSNRIDRTTIRPEPKAVGKKGQRRPIIVDGSNVAFQYGRNETFRAQGIRLVYDYFFNKGMLKRSYHERVNILGKNYNKKNHLIKLE